MIKEAKVIPLKQPTKGSDMEDNKEIAKLQHRRGGTLVVAACTALVAYAGVLLAIAFG